MIENEVPLTGGNVNESVVRIGNTVRRTLSKHSRNVHRLLKYLENRNFQYSPQFLGIDDQNREILSYMEGTTDFPSDIWRSTPAFVKSVEMLRQYHDAQFGFDRYDDDWAFIFEGDYPNDVICHNDFAPYNMIFNDGVPTAIIDFDLCGPGPRLRDLAYLAYWMVPLSFSDSEMSRASFNDLDNNCARLKLVCKAYGTNDYCQLLDLVSSVLHHMSNRKAAAKMVGKAVADRLEIGGHFAHWCREAVAFDEYRTQVEEKLM